MKHIRHVTCTGEKTKAYIILVGKPEGEGVLGRNKPSWEDIKIIFKKLVGRTWTALVWNKLGVSGGLL
jgi:hypothetical protein